MCTNQMLHLLNKEDWCQVKSQGAADTQALSECCGENKGAKVAAIAAARMEESVEAAVTAGKGIHLLSTVFSFCPKKCPGDQGLQGWTVRSWPFSLHQMFTASACAWSWPQSNLQTPGCFTSSTHLLQQESRFPSYSFPLLPLSALIILMFPYIMAEVTSRARISVFPI